MLPNADMEAIHNVLVRLGGKPAPLAVQLPREPGRREQRWAYPGTEPAESTSPAATVPDLARRVAALEQDVGALRAELAGLRARLGE
jgi:uncharacterized protein YceH (UPF0502 family)